MPENNSILNSVKKALGVDESYKVFDPDIQMYINSVFSTLHQLGVGPDKGFYIEDENDTWETFMGDDIQLNAVKTYMCLRVRLLFDPPTTSFAIDAIKKQIEELEWRLNVHVENNRPTPTIYPLDLSGKVL